MWLNCKGLNILLDTAIVTSWKKRKLFFVNVISYMYSNFVYMNCFTIHLLTSYFKYLDYAKTFQKYMDEG